jgi:hypothetical protein
MLGGIDETDGARRSPKAISPFGQPCLKCCFIVHRRVAANANVSAGLWALYYHSTPHATIPTLSEWARAALATARWRGQERSDTDP